MKHSSSEWLVPNRPQVAGFDVPGDNWGINCMKLTVDFDEETLRRYEARGSPMLFYIYWRSEERFYPDAAWMDFGATILSWWVMGLCDLARGRSEARLSFMDGPFAIDISLDRSTGHVLLNSSDRSCEWQMTLNGLAAQVREAIVSVLSKLEEENLGLSDRNNLVLAEVMLREAFPQLGRQR